MVKGADSPSNINPAARDSSGAILINARSIVPRLRLARRSKMKSRLARIVENAGFFTTILMKLIGKSARKTHRTC
jgi:hypothetical protein